MANDLWPILKLYGFPQIHVIEMHCAGKLDAVDRLDQPPLLVSGAWRQDAQLCLEATAGWLVDDGIGRF